MKGKITAVACIALLLLAASAYAEKITMNQDEELGKFLADSKGMTLYYFKKDSPGQSNCSGACVRNWPVFHADDITPPEGVDAKLFGIITRSDGQKQTTFKDYPLYYFAGDAKSGDANGQGLGNVWYVVNPEKFMK